MTTLVRDAVPADYDAYARLVPELGVDDPLPSRERFCGELLARTLVATHGDDVVGYALVEQLADVGYIRNVVTAPAMRRGGVGRALMAAMRARFVEHGATTWCLNVKPSNVAAIALYERSGLAAAYHAWALRLPGAVALPPPPAAITMAEIEPVDDARIESHFALLRGQLASSRGRASRQVLQLQRDGELVGVGVFSAAVPGAFPFRTTEPALGAPFLAHLRTRIPADAPFLQVAIEADEALRDHVLALGAYLQLEILHMRGPL